MYGRDVICAIFCGFVYVLSNDGGGHSSGETYYWVNICSYRIFCHMVVGGGYLPNKNALWCYESVEYCEVWHVMEVLPGHTGYRVVYPDTKVSIQSEENCCEQYVIQSTNEIKCIPYMMVNKSERVLMLDVYWLSISMNLHLAINNDAIP